MHLSIFQGPLGEMTLGREAEVEGPLLSILRELSC